MRKLLDRLIGTRVKRIFMNEDYLKFETDAGNIVFNVMGECCSRSIFYDFYGVKKLLTGNKITAVKTVKLKPSDIISVEGCEKDKKSQDESIQVYGFQIFTDDSKLGEVTSVFSFRNYSNGYYGGELEDAKDREVKPEIFADVIESARVK